MRLSIWLQSRMIQWAIDLRKQRFAINYKAAVELARSGKGECRCAIICLCVKLQCLWLCRRRAKQESSKAGSVNRLCSVESNGREGVDTDGGRSIHSDLPQVWQRRAE